MDYEFLNDIVVTVDYYNHRICTANWEIEEVVMDFVDISYVISGQAEYIINGIKYTVSAGDLLCIPYGSTRSATSNPNALMECYSINGKVRNINGEDITLPLPLICNIGLHKDLLSLYNNLNTVWTLKDPGYILRAKGLYLMILQRYFQIIIFQKDTSMVDTRIKKVLHYISNHYKEPLTVHKMAKMINLSDMYFGTLFKKETGMSFRNFLTLVRMNRAEEMLYSGEYKIHEISDACGFSDVFYFSRIFKKHRGMSPSDAIRQNKSEDDLYEG
ncbi:MAG: helix-turn-helix transcriptional regulator [Clostridiales bacterium]|jgi:AraC-like DNA-binding protein|nr:helix-turn-helix transcriptional regulator [Clostridiales bacterium]